MSAVDVSPPGSRFRSAFAGAGTALGVLAFAADLLDGWVGQVTVALTSSGFAWGLAAVLAGRSAGTRRRAVTGATGLLVLATAVYYLLILLVSRRWSGATLVDGSSADLAGLRSVALMTTVWLLGSLIAGPLLGLLGHTVRTATTTRAAAAAGAACGLLSAEGWQTIAAAPPWPLLTLDDPFLNGFLAARIVRVLLPLVVLIWLTAVHRLGRAWPALLAATAAATTIGALLWEAVELVRRG